MDPRAAGLGAFAAFPDELLDLFLREHLDARALAALSCCSRVLCVWATEEPLWLDLHLARRKAPFEYKVRPRLPLRAAAAAAAAGEWGESNSSLACGLPSVPPRPSPAPQPTAATICVTRRAAGSPRKCTHACTNAPQGSWRATYLAYNPACRWPDCTAAALRPRPQVPGFSSLFLYRWA